MLALRKHSPGPVRLILTIAFIYGFFWIKGWPREYDDEELPTKRPSHVQTSLGPHLVDTNQFVVSVTTTAVDAYSKLAPMIVYTTPEDAPQLLFFGDLQIEIGSWPVFDVLWHYPGDFLLEAKELGRYRAQVDYSRKSLPIHKLRKQDEREEKEIVAILDKYKILQTMSAAWQYRPQRNWYAFVSDETYLNRANIYDWLSQYDPMSKHFIVNPPTPGLPDPYANGGTSFIVSRKVMEELFVDRKDVIIRWLKSIEDHTSAFDLVSGVLKQELKLSANGVWPGISGFDPTTIPFSPGLWCDPVLMMHHITADVGSDLWKLHRERGEQNLAHSPLRFADLWQHFMAPENLNNTRNDWDNLSSDPSNARWNILFEGDRSDEGRAKKGEESAEACQQSCNRSEYCMQWSYSSLPENNWNDNPQTRCHLSNSVRFGRHAERQERDINGGEKAQLTWTSGWRTDRFTAWARQQHCNPTYKK